MVTVAESIVAKNNTGTVLTIVILPKYINVSIILLHQTKRYKYHNYID